MIQVCIKKFTYYLKKKYILNPSNQQIQVSESAIKFLISKYLQKVLNKEKLVSSDEDHKAVQPAIMPVGVYWSIRIIDMLNKKQPAFIKNRT